MQRGSAGGSDHASKGTALEVMESVTAVMAATSGVMSFFVDSLFRALPATLLLHLLL
jgi:hypothetical protein